MGDVTEFIIDGVSGLAPGGVEGKCLVVGCCSLGQSGKGYLLGRRSDLTSLLGVGPLVDALRDVFAAGGQEPYVVAVPAPGAAGGYITPCRHEGDGPEAQSAGLPLAAADIVAVVTVAGANGEAALKVSLDGGDTFPETAAVPENGEAAIGETGARLIFQATLENPLIVDDAYSFKVVTPLSQHRQSGPGPAVTAAGEPKAGGQLQLMIVKGGELNTATYRLSIDGGDNFGPTRTLPLDAEIEVADLGFKLELAAGEYQAGSLYSWEVLPPVPTTAAVMEALSPALEQFDVEFVYVVGPSDSVDWSAAAALAQEMWNSHRPTYFKFETRPPYADEDLSDWAVSLLEERAGFASMYVQAVAAFGEVTDSSGLSKVRSWGGLNAGRTLANPVQRAAGRVRDGGLGQAVLPEGWNETLHKALTEAGFVTAKRYAGKNGVFWSDSVTMAEVGSDYQYEEVLRVVFKALRKCRIAALNSLYDEAGDPVLPESAAGLKYLEASLEAALDAMVKARPPEMADYVVDIPLNQDIAGNGVLAELTFIGIPIIRSIKLYGRYVYAGGKFDPRLEDENEQSY
jgi:hypothetical protein